MNKEGGVDAHTHTSNPCTQTNARTRTNTQHAQPDTDREREIQREHSTYNISPGLVEILFEVHLEVLEHKGERGGGVDDVVQGHNVCVLEVAKEGRLPNGCARCPFLMV